MHGMLLSLPVIKMIHNLSRKASNTALPSNDKCFVVSRTFKSDLDQCWRPFSVGSRRRSYV